ncbi:hypothetical protein [Deinococcus pimensis]|uniref:hypothetical protein n=1 Tax=Deinococcus pimensis TaxID=309888 RepID=UPI0004888564|nr:hypothetical protein [Deinococcus pimensis]
MTDRDKSVGERLGEAADAVKSKVNEGADRARAEGHDFNAETADNPVDRVVEKGKAVVDRAKAGLHGANADRQARDAGE